MVEQGLGEKFCQVSGLCTRLFQIAPGVAHRVGSSICRSKQGIVGKVRVPGCLNDVGMPKRTADHKQGMACIHEIAGEGVAEVMNANILQSSPPTRRVPRLMEIRIGLETSRIG